MLIRLISFITIFFMFGCSTFNKKELSNQERFEKGEHYFLKNKFQKAKTEFEFIIQEDQGTNLSLKSTLYLAKTLFELKLYEEASYNFNYYSMFSKDINNIEFAQFMKCKCSFEMTKPYNNDQSDSFLCISVIQEFIDNFSYSIYVDDAYDMVIQLRNRISKKYYETGRLYLKMKEFDSAFYYFNIVLSDYYDTKYYDEAIISYIFTYIVMDDYNQADIYLNSNQNKFKSNQKLKEAQKLLSNYKDGIGLSGYFRLYR